jgi:hypothetical protein
MNIPAAEDDVLAGYVAGAFGETQTDLSEGFLRELRTNWREVLARSRRLVFLVVMLTGLFTLLAGADVSEIGFTGIKLTPGAFDVIATAIPAVIAYLFAQYWELYVLADRYQEIHNEIYAQLSPGMEPLDQAMHPPDTNHFGSFELVMLKRTGPGQTILAVTSIVNWLFTFLAPFVLIATLFFFLPRDFQVSPLAYAISLVVSVFFAIRAVSFMALSETPVGSESKAASGAG